MQGEGAPGLAFATVARYHAHPSSERLDHVAHHAQPEAAARDAVGLRVLAAVERLEEVGEVLAPDARPMVGHRDLDPLFRVPRLEADPTFGTSMADGVLDEIAQSAPQGRAV